MKKFQLERSNRLFLSKRYHTTNEFNLDSITKFINLASISKIDRSFVDCWNWPHGLYSSGYGQIRIGKYKYRTHRVSYSMYFARDITSSEYVCHSCDNPQCFNPLHLSIGSPLSNMRDMISRARKITKNGEDNHYAKLNKYNVIAIRYLLSAGLTCKTIGAIFGVTPDCIGRIKRNETWKQLKGG